MHRLVYPLNIAQLVRDYSEDYKKIEDDIVDTLERCRKWNGILQIKDLDYYLEKTLGPCSKHDTIAILTHHLTTHPGLVFFTTENASTMDSLLTSHFDLTIEVPASNTASRRILWETAITQALPLRQRHFTSEHLEKLGETELSGREISSAVKMAQIAAKGEDEPLKMVHLEKVLAIKARSKAKAQTGKCEIE